MTALASVKSTIKNFIEFTFSRSPSFYARILRHKPNTSSEKVLFLDLVHDKDTVVDIGANRGRYTVLFSHIVGKKGRVHAFEPVPRTFTFLSEHVARNGRLGNVQLTNTAVGDRVGGIELYMPNDDSEQASMARHGVGSWSGTPVVTSYSCNLVTLDSYATQYGFEKLDFVKIDVEGAELFVLRGAVMTLNRFKPLIYLEVNPQWTKNFDYVPADLFTLLKSFGYDKFFVTGEVLVRLGDPASEYAVGHYPESVNILCAVTGLHDHRLALLVPQN